MESFGPFGTKTYLNEIRIGGRKIVAERILAGRIVDYIRFGERAAIDINLLVDDADAVAGQADDALHIVRMVIKGKFEDNHVATADRAIRKNFFIPRVAPFENEFIDEQMIANKQSWLHGLRGNLEGLDDEGGAEKREQHGDQKRFEIFRKRASAGFVALDDWRGQRVGGCGF